jgi:hypothetical protein
MRRPYVWLRHALIVARFVCLSGFCNSFFRRGDVQWMLLFGLLHAALYTDASA